MSKSPANGQSGVVLFFPGETPWMVRLREIAEELRSLNRSTEGEFLEIGEKLQGIHQSTDWISTLSTSLTAVLSGEEIVSTMNSLGSIALHVQDLQAEAMQNTSMLQKVLENLEDIRRQLSYFDNAVRELRVLCISMRIESARLGEGDAGFNTLADDVDRLVVDVGSKCGRLLGTIESVDIKLRQTLARALEIEAAQIKDARVILQDALSNLDLLKERHRLSSDGTQLIVARYDSVKRSIGEIILSLQFHDITRQQIEHATESLSRLTDMNDPPQENTVPAPDGAAGAFRNFFQPKDARARRGGGDENGYMSHPSPGVVRDVCRLQAAQLRRARDELVSAVRRIIDNLRAIASLVDDISNETSKIARNSNGSSDSCDAGCFFLDELRIGFSSLAPSLSHYAETSRELSQVVKSIGRAMDEMMTFAGGIQAIGTSIKLIALNAIIKACHMDQQGAPLAVLSEGVHRLSLDTCRQTNSISDALGSIDEITGALLGRIDSKKENTDTVDLMNGDTRNLFETLQTVTEKTASTLGSVEEQGLRLFGDIERTVESITVHHRVTQVLDRVIAELTEIVEQIGPGEDGEESPMGAEHLEVLEASYTMQAEREVHESLAGMQPRREAASPPKEPAADHEQGSEDGSEGKDDDDLGDNVELF